MANHKSSKKRIRQTATKRAHNRLYHKTTRNAVKALRNTSERNAAEALLPKVSAMLDKLAKHNIIHKNKAANLKSSLALHVKDTDPVEAIHIQEIVDLFGQSPFLWLSSPIGCYRDRVHVPQPTTERAIFRMTDFIRNGLSARQTLARR